MRISILFYFVITVLSLMVLGCFISSHYNHCKSLAEIQIKLDGLDK